MEYKEEDFLMLSGIQHYTFCPRQWALIHIEQQWQENLRTVEGNLLHKKAHDGYSTEKRNDLIISRGMPIFSRDMGISGICDIVEFYENDKGVPIFGREGKFIPYPVEYKKGKPKDSEIDIMQLTAQSMCLEEMLCCEITEGALFYGEIKRRERITITNELKESVRKYFVEMHALYERRHTPNVKKRKSCNACSLKDICVPNLSKTSSVNRYIAEHISGGDDEEIT